MKKNIYLVLIVVLLLFTLFTSSCSKKTTEPQTDATDGTEVPDGMIFVSGGTFNNGTSDVTLSSFYIAKYQTMQYDYQAMMGLNPSWNDDNPAKPVDSVSWFDAIEYCNRRSMQKGLTPCYSYGSFGKNPEDWPSGWNTNSNNHTNVSCDWTANGYRLPTEMEWEFAARAGNKSEGYIFSGSNDINAVAWYDGNSYNMGSSHPDYGTHAVGTKLPNELGIYDMSGNVEEWCWDRWASYPSGAQTNPQGPTDDGYSYHMVRGGSWYDSANSCAVSYRYGYYAARSNRALGFRVVRNAR